MATIKIDDAAKQALTGVVNGIIDQFQQNALQQLIELGEKEKELHAEVGAYAAEKQIDALICIGALSQNMYDAAEKVENTTYIW